MLRLFCHLAQSQAVLFCPPRGIRADAGNLCKAQLVLQGQTPPQKAVLAVRHQRTPRCLEPQIGPGTQQEQRQQSQPAAHRAAALPLGMQLRPAWPCARPARALPAHGNGHQAVVLEPGTTQYYTPRLDQQYVHAAQAAPLQPQALPRLAPAPAAGQTQPAAFLSELHIRWGSASQGAAQQPCSR